MSLQLKIDFSTAKVSIEDEKQTEPISIRVGEKFKTDMEAMAKLKNIDFPKLLKEYLAKGYIEDYKNLLLMEINGHRTVNEIAAKS